MTRRWVIAMTTALTVGCGGLASTQGSDAGESPASDAAGSPRPVPAAPADAAPAADARSGDGATVFDPPDAAPRPPSADGAPPRPSADATPPPPSVDAAPPPAVDGSPCPPPVVPTGDPEILLDGGVGQHVQVSDLEVLPDGLIVQVASYGGRGGSCYRVDWLPHGSTTLEAVSPGCTSYAHGWGDLIWFRTGVEPLTAVRVDDVRTPFVVETVDDALQHAVGPAGVVYKASSARDLYHHPTPQDPARHVASFPEDRTLAALAMGSRHAYLVSSERFSRRSALVEVDLTSEATKTITEIDGYCCGRASLVLGGGFAYVEVTTDAGYDLHGIDLGSGARRLVTSIPAPTTGRTFVAANSEYVYWVEPGADSTQPSTVYEERHCGGPAARVADVHRPLALAADEEHVYWATLLQLARL